MSRIRRHLFISGRVQGVCYRYYTRQTALQNGVSGWVRNLPDGRVETLMEGEEAAVIDTINWCRKGPDMAQVDLVEVKEQEVIGLLEGFSIC